jgi:transposase
VSIPQTHEAGAESEVDFGEFYATIAGLVVNCWMFVMRLSHSGKSFHVAFAIQAQEAFLEGHVLAFEYFGGVPGRIRYDNLKPAVIRVLKGVTAPSPNGSPHCAATTGSTRSSAAPASTARMRRVAWKARSAASVGAISSRSPRSPRWRN